MAFPFPLNPADGQVVSYAASDGSIIKATYTQTKNEWIITRQLPAPTPLTGTPPINVSATADGQVITWDQALNTWVAKAPAASSGGTGQTYVKGTKAAPDTPNPPDPTKPTQTLRPGALQTTVENLHHELKAWDGGAWVDVLTEDDIKQWIAAGSLFRSTLQAAGISGLPAPATANRGYYWTWAGASGYVIKAGDTPLAPDLVGEVLNPGDWLQSDGTKYVHVSGDLLSKQRWLSLGSFTPWSDTSWESGSVVSYQKAFFRSTANVQTGDAPPGDGSTGNKWQDITPLPSINTGDLTNVNANTINPGQHGMVFQWDDNVQEWVASDTLDVAEVKTSGIKFGDFDGEIQYVTDDLSAVPSADEDITVPNVYALKDYVTGYVTGQSKPFLEELDDCTKLAAATDGQVPTWDDANQEWIPTAITSPILFLGTGAWVSGDVTDPAKRYGMAADTNPSPAAWPPIAGDQYIDLTTGNITLFTGAGGSTTRRGALLATGGANPGLDAIRETLASLSDVDLSVAPVMGNFLMWNDVSKKWVAAQVAGKLDELTDTTQLGSAATGDSLKWDGTKWVPELYITKSEVDTRLTALVTGLEHFEAVLSRTNAPPVTPSAGDVFIVGVAPTGAWAGQANNLARWDGAAWAFSPPKNNESHLVEDVSETWHWNGTGWVKVATATTGGTGGAAEQWMVGDIKQSMLSEPQFKTLLSVTEQTKWVLADGRDVTGTIYATATGKTTVPDLRGAYIRMAGKNAAKTDWDGGTLATFREDSTALAKNHFVAARDGNHKHEQGYYTTSPSYYAYGHRFTGTNGPVSSNEASTNPRDLPFTSTNGAHTHAIQGGDPETRPKTYSVNYFIKVN
jgi:hypothetical protein